MTTVSLSSNRRTGFALFVELMPLIALLWVFLFIRLDRLATFPLFVDEVRHIARANIVWEFVNLDVNTTPRKFLLYYYLGLFDMPTYDAAWMGRAPLAIFSLIGAAATFTVGRLLFSRKVGMAALAFLAIFPFMFFYERMALSDPLTATFGILVVWASVLVSRQPSPSRALVLAFLINLMLAAKTLALPLLIMPVAAVLLLGSHRLNFNGVWRKQIVAIWRVYFPAARRIFLLSASFWGIVLGFYVLRLIIEPETVSPIINSYLYSRPEQTTNFQRVGQIIESYWGIPFFILTLVAWGAAGKSHWRETLFLLVGVLALWLGVIAVANRLSTRYLTLVGHFWAILTAAGLVTLHEMMKRFLQKRTPPLKLLAWTPAALALVWVLFFVRPFWLDLTRAPLELELPSRDVQEYYRDQSAYGLVEAVADVATFPSISAEEDAPVVYGIVRNCGFLTYHMQAGTPLHLECYKRTVQHEQEWPNLDLQVARFNERVASYGALYLLVEEFWEQPLLEPSQIEGCVVWLATYGRPFDGVPLDVYAVYESRSVPPNVHCMTVPLRAADYLTSTQSR